MKMEAEYYADRLMKADKRILALEAELAAERAKVERLRNALGPFAFDPLLGRPGDEPLMLCGPRLGNGPVGPVVMVSDLRRAAETWKECQ